MADSDVTFYRESYVDAMSELLGAPFRSYLREKVTHRALAGEEVFIDGAGVGTDAELNVWGSFEDKTDTPDYDVNRQRTLFQGQQIAWGHLVSKKRQIGEVIDPTNYILRGGARAIFKQQDFAILKGLFAASTSRKNSSGTIASVNMPTAQIITLSSGTLDTDVLHEVQSVLENNYALDRQICGCISPRSKKDLKQNDDKVSDMDFVNSAEFFKTGRLPMVDNIAMAIHPLLTWESGVGDPINTDTSYEYAVFWLGDSVVQNTFEPMSHYLEGRADKRFRIQTYSEEVVDVQRIDDSGVVWVKIPRS